MVNFKFHISFITSIILALILIPISNSQADLLAHWELNSSYLDSSGNNYNATARSAGATWKPNEGKDGALALTGNKDYMKFKQINIGNQFTVMAWVKPTENPQTWARLIESHFNSGFYLGTNDSNPRKWMFSINGTFNLMPTPVIIGEWQHIAGTYDGTTAKLYVNGQLLGSAAQPAPTNPNDYVVIGNNPDELNDWSMVSIIDEVKLYNEPLDSSIIRQTYELGFSDLNLSDPDDTAVLPNVSDSASFSVDIATPSGIDVNACSWFRNKNGSLTEIIPDNNKYIVATTSQNTNLTINNVTSNDIAQYYCTVIATSGSATDSSQASLKMSTGLLHQYSFNDGTTNDQIGTANAVMQDPSHKSSISNGQLILGNDGSQRSGDSASSISYLKLPNGLISNLDNFATIEIWCTNTQTLSNYTRLFSFGDSISPNAGMNTGLLIDAQGGRGVIDFEIFKNHNHMSEVEAQEAIPVNQEYMLAIVWDGNRKSVTLYVNGQYMGSDYTDIKLSDFNDIENWVGRSKWGNDKLYSGKINEIRVYDWPYSQHWIQAHYEAGPNQTNVNPCIDKPLADLNDDCKVDMADFAELASDWLEYGILDGQNNSLKPKPQSVKLFNLHDVRLLDSPFKIAQDYDKNYLLSIDANRMLHGMRVASGVGSNSSNYGGWAGWGSVAAGPYLSACSLMYAATGDYALLDRVNYMVDGMVECQNAWGDGELNVNDIEAEWFRQLASGNLQTSHVLAWYQTHKIHAGLRDAWLVTGNTKARDALIWMADWAIDVTANLTDQQWQSMLGCEHGAPHEIIAEAYAITGKKKYLDNAMKYRHYWVFDPMLVNDIARLYWLHGNTQITKFVGYQRVSEINDHYDWYLTSKNFFDLVTNHLSWSNGSNTQLEGFFPESYFETKVEDNCGPETCNTFNMLKMTRSLYQKNSDASYIDYYENALYNHILPSIDPYHGGFVYYTSMRPGHYRIFSSEYNSFWCCVVTGMENPARYGDMIYAYDNQSLFVNMFIPSVLTWDDKGLTLRQETTFPKDNFTTLKLKLNEPRKFALKIRCPKWFNSSNMNIRINDQLYSYPATKSEYIAINRLWQNGDQVEIELDTKIRTEYLPGSNKYASIHYGPVMLAGSLGACDLSTDDFRGGTQDQAAYKKGLWSDVPVFVGTKNQIESQIVRKSGEEFAFETIDLAKPNDAKLIPFYNLHHERYVIYWPISTTTAYPPLRAQMDQEDEVTLRLRSNVDHVEIGAYSWPEEQHNLQGVDMASGGLPGIRWRSANNGGWFSYDIDVLPNKPMTIVCRYWGSDGGSRTFDIKIDNSTIATESLNSSNPGQYIYKYYSVPTSLTNGKTKVTVKFDARSGNIAGGLFELWVIEFD